MSDDLIIAQVSDMHIGASDVFFKGINVRQQFLKILKVLAKKRLDLLILSGDLAALEGEPEAYTWLKQVLETFPYPYILMAGNHDHVGRMQMIFDLPENDISQGMLYFSRKFSGKRLIFLDSASYRIPKRQLEWLSNELAMCEEPVLLFVHHPPLLCECQFMDERHPLQNIEEVWQTLDQFPQVEHIFCGHYHAEKTVMKNEKSIYITPSTVFQIDMDSPQFVIEHTKPGWRMIEWADNYMQTYVEYL